MQHTQKTELASSDRHITGMVGVLCGKSHRIESGHKLQETEITIWRPAQGLLTTLQQQTGGDRRCQIHQSSSLVYPTPPEAVWPPPTLPHKCTETQLLQTTKGHFLCTTGHQSSKGWEVKYLAIFPHKNFGLVLLALHLAQVTKLKLKVYWYFDLQQEARLVILSPTHINILFLRELSLTNLVFSSSSKLGR